jgi:hypothetical protein
MSEALREKEVPGGLVHDLPADLKKALASDAEAMESRRSTSLARVDRDTSFACPSRARQRRSG